MTASGPHLDPGTLAALGSGALPTAEAVEAERHVAGCELCAEALFDVVPPVRTEAGPDPVVPHDVAARIAAALATEAAAAASSGASAAAASSGASATVTPLRRRRWVPTTAQLGAVAASVAVLAAGVVGVRALVADGGGSSAGSASTAMQDSTGSALSPAAPPVTRSGTAWTATSLRTAAPRLAQPSGTAESLKSAEPPAGASGGPSAPSERTTSEDTSVLDPLVAAPALQRCVADLTGEQTTAPLAVDVGRYGGRPVAVVVVPTTAQPSSLDVWVVGPGCASDVRLFLRTTR